MSDFKDSGYREHNFIQSSDPNDKELFFGPIESHDLFYEIESNWTMAHIVVKAGVFLSATQARSN